MLFNVHLCNHILLYVVVEPGAQLCTPLKVNRRKLGCRRLARKRSVRRGSGAPDVDGPGACLSQPLGVDVDSLVFIHLIPRIDHKLRMVINRLNHHSSNIFFKSSTDIYIYNLDIYLIAFDPPFRLLLYI